MQDFEDFTARSGGRFFWNDGGTSSSLVALPGSHCGEIMDAIRLGRLTALRKPNGGVRGIVVGDIVRRLVGRTMAQQFSSVCSFHQFQDGMRLSRAPNSDRSG